MPDNNHACYIWYALTALCDKFPVGKLKRNQRKSQHIRSMHHWIYCDCIVSLVRYFEENIYSFWRLENFTINSYWNQHIFHQKLQYHGVSIVVKCLEFWKSTYFKSKRKKGIHIMKTENWRLVALSLPTIKDKEHEGFIRVTCRRSPNLDGFPLWSRGGSSEYSLTRCAVREVGAFPFN